MLVKTEEALQKLAHAVARRKKKPFQRDEIGLKVGRVLNRWKMAKHFRLTITDGHLAWQRRAEAIKAEETLDGIYADPPDEGDKTMP